MSRPSLPTPFEPSGRETAGEPPGLSPFGPVPSWVGGLLFALAVLPVGYVLWRTSEARLDVAYWDEFDTVLAFLLRLKEGISPGAFLSELFSVNNEHRMATSRLLFAVYFWLSGTINFTVLDWIGISWIVFACLLLVLATRPGSRRLKFAALLACLFSSWSITKISSGPELRSTTSRWCCWPPARSSPPPAAPGRA